MKYMYFVKRGNKLETAFPDDNERLGKYKDGEIIRAAIHKSHSPQQHKAVFAVARTVLMNAPEDDSVLGKWGALYQINQEDTVYNFIKMCMVELGYFDIVQRVNKEPLIMPRSLRYDEMDKEEFSLFFDSYLELCAKLLKIEKKQLLKHYPKEV